MDPRTHTRARVADLVVQGLTQAEIARRLGLSRGAIAYHVRKLGVAADPRFARRHDWTEIQAYHDAGHSMRACQQRFGFSAQTWHAAKARGVLVARPAGSDLSDLLVVAPRSRRNIVRRLLAEGVKVAACEGCGLVEWRGAPLVLQLHHVNGVGDDNRLENLQLLCPNCHSQTGNWGGRNRRRGSGPGAVAG